MSELLSAPTPPGTTPGLRRIVIDPVTRVEGHAKVTLHLDEAGELVDARFHVTEFRGFERFCEGRPFWEMPGITARICGICPVSHLLASAKAGDEILGVTVPPAAAKLRRLMNLAQIVQSHALSFFYLSSPDLLLGFDSDPARRNILGVAEAHPEVARAGIRLRQFGQRVIAHLGGQSIHPSWAVPGGVRAPLTAEARDEIRAALPEQIEAIQHTLARFKADLGRFDEEARVFGRFPSLFMSLVGPDGEWEHHDGRLRIVDGEGQTVEDGIDPRRYHEYIGEATEPWSYLKFPYYRPAGYPEGSYRVGPLARLNVCRRIGTPLADAELDELRDRRGPTLLSSFDYHQARLIEILACLELIERALADPDLLSTACRAAAGVNRLEGVGVSEAPRGTLFHHYRVDETGLLTWVNLLIATGQNNLAMNRTVAQVARHYVHGGSLEEGLLNRIEASIRAYDPCLSCSTHAVGKMPLVVQALGPDGLVVSEVRR
jgi:NAD-reducing hydrogenase large subunit